MVQFRNEDDYNSVINSRPLAIGYRPVIVRKWSKEYDLRKEIIRCIHVWFKLPNLTLRCWSGDSLNWIAQLEK